MLCFIPRNNYLLYAGLDVANVCIVAVPTLACFWGWAEVLSATFSSLASQLPDKIPRGILSLPSIVSDNAQKNASEERENQNAQPALEKPSYLPLCPPPAFFS